jgi:hypothetical protein
VKLSLLAVLLTLAAWTGTAAQSSTPAGAPEDQPRPAQGASVEAGQNGGWNFDEEEEEAPSWAADIRAQAVDLLAVGAFLAFAFVSFFRKSVILKYVTLVGAVAYLGFYKSLLISIVNVFGLFGGNLPIFRQNLAWYLLAVVTIVSTVLWGRVYCGRLCAFGAFTQLLDGIAPNRWQIKIPRAIERRASMIKYGILIGAITWFLATRDPLFYPYIEPFWMFGLYGKTLPLYIALGVLLIVRAQRLLPVLVSAGRRPWRPVEADRIPNQAVVGMHTLPDLREGLRMGRDPRAPDRDDRMRAL